MNDTLEIVELDIDLNLEPQCEFLGHGDPRLHDDGPARWILKQACPYDCGYGATRLACEKRVQVLKDGMVFRCNNCTMTFPGYDIIVSLHRL